ncbi:cation diffusion facilitator family transporter [Corynebacterium pseudopelargi]|uniref:Cation efflux family protein n=1 Tax=Corynebacterium pseudopelargi TaxID=2080757 RepID=A0A3G6IWS1_9CORY|nr:cation transporter [Corynebacterium pseudopelargi]AZA10239.1 Cation efflux family protein [Corynebacterium pseudopelargi]
MSTKTLQARVRLIVGIAIAWNVVEAAISIWAGHEASSAALIGFGLDSTVEVLSAAVVAWQFSAPDPEQREAVALKLIAGCFFLLAFYVTFEALTSQPAQHSTIGITITALSAIVMPALALWQRRTGQALGSASVIADSKQRLICAMLSVATLAGLVLNSLFGWHWADSVAALIIAAFAVREGIEALRGDPCC